MDLNTKCSGNMKSFSIRAKAEGPSKPNWCLSPSHLINSFHPCLRDEGISWLRASLKPPDRRKQVTFTTPYLPKVDEIVVSHKGTKGLNDLTDLSGRRVAVVRASSYVDSLKSLNSQLRAQKRKPVNIFQVSENLEAEDILELVNAGVLKVTVVDRHIAELWSGVLTNLVLHTKLKANQGGTNRVGRPAQ